MMRSKMRYYLNVKKGKDMTYRQEEIRKAVQYLQKKEIEKAAKRQTKQYVLFVIVGLAAGIYLGWSLCIN